MYEILKGNRARFMSVAALCLLVNLVNTVVDPLLTKALFDQGLMQKDGKRFLMIALIMIAFGTAIRFVLFLQKIAVQKLKNRVAYTFAMNSISRFYDLPYEQVASQDPGYFLSRVYDEPSKAAIGAVEVLLDFCIYLAGGIGALGVCLYLSWKLTILLLLIIPVLYVISQRFRHRITKGSKAEQENEAQLREMVASGVSAFKLVRLFGLKPVVLDRCRKRFMDYHEAVIHRLITAQSYVTLSNVTMSYAEAGVMGFAGYAVVGNRMSIGGLMGFMSSFWKLIGAYNSIIATLSESSKNAAYRERVQELMALANDRDPHHAANLSLRGASIGYGDSLVLEKVDASFERGSAYLILGPNGSGKSTLAYVLSGLLSPKEGTLERPSMARISAMLLPLSFAPCSLREHVHFDDMAQDRRNHFLSLAEKLGMHDKLDQPSLLQLSEGEKKKAQLLITLMKDADYYIFDEPLSNIDVAAKDIIMEAIFGLPSDKCVIVILHGDETYHGKFDRILHIADLNGSRLFQEPCPAEVEP